MRAALLRFLFMSVAGWTFYVVPLALLAGGFSLSEMGALVAVMTISSLLVSGPFGFLTDFRSPRTLFLVGLCGVSLFFVLLSQGGGFWSVAAAMALGGIAYNLAEMSSRSLSYKQVSAKRRGRDVGVSESAKFLGMAFGLLAAGFVFNAVGFADGLKVFALACAPLFAYAFLVRETRVSVFGESYKAAFWDPRMLPLFLGMFLIAFHWGTENSVMSVYVREVIGLDLFWTGAFLAAGVGIFAVFNYVAGRGLDACRLGRKRYTLAVVAAALSTAAFGFTSSFAGALAARAVHEVADAFICAFAFYTLSRIGERERIGGVQGVYVVVALVGAALGAWTSGWTAQSFGLPSAFVFGGAAILAGGAAMLFFGKELFR